MGIQETGYNYPNSVVTRTHQGDGDYAAKFRPESDILLYQLKNLMSFQHLTQLKMSRFFTDGTIIAAWSIVNQTTKVATDFVDIDVRKSSGVTGRAYCVITFINFPAIVPPMQNPGEIADGEVEGEDYFKTYYTLDLRDCGNCSDITWDFILDYIHPVESRHWVDPDTGEEDVEDHTVYSLDHPAWGEIITNDRDAGGEYIIWKAYTEAGIPFSRTGLAVPLLQASVLTPEGNTVCTQEVKFDVDCCEKDSDDRPVEIWWEDFGTCTPYISYTGVAYNAICKAPTSIPMYGSTGLIFYACTAPYQPFYAIPEILGTCFPVEWSLSGPIAFMNSDKDDNLIFLSCSAGPGDCYLSALITLNDRCGGQYQIDVRPCCTDAEPVVMNYTSLIMACSQQQTLSVTGGCSPYSWSLSGGGSLSADNGIEIIYSSPATNPNCTMNPTITVTDCCGNSASIQLAVNCYTADDWAYTDSDETQTSCSWTGSFCKYQGTGYCHAYNCAGILLYDVDYPIDAIVVYWGTDACDQHIFDAGTCSEKCALGPQGRCPGNIHCSMAWGYADVRTTAMRNAGCCPLNPETGLPY